MKDKVATPTLLKEPAAYGGLGLIAKASKDGDP